MELEKLTFEQLKSFSGKDFVDHIADNGAFIDIEDLSEYGDFIRVICKAMDYDTVYTFKGLSGVFMDKDLYPINEVASAIKKIGASEYADVLSELNDYLLPTDNFDSIYENNHIMSVIKEYEDRLNQIKNDMEHTFFELMYSYADNELQKLK